MRTNIDIDDKLMKRAMKASEATTKRAVVEEALQLLVRVRSQDGIRKWFGKAEWQGDLDGDRRYDKWQESEQRADVVTKAMDTGRKAA